MTDRELDRRAAHRLAVIRGQRHWRPPSDQVKPIPSLPMTGYPSERPGCFPAGAFLCPDEPHVSRTP
jgi:hypothetical protein